MAQHEYLYLHKCGHWWRYPTKNPLQAPAGVQTSPICPPCAGEYESHALALGWPPLTGKNEFRIRSALYFRKLAYLRFLVVREEFLKLPGRAEAVSRFCDKFQEVTLAQTWNASKYINPYRWILRWKPR